MDATDGGKRGRANRASGADCRCTRAWRHSLAPCLSRCHGWRHVAAAGIDKIPAFGPGLLPLAHWANEFIHMESIGQTTRIYARSALYFLQAAENGDVRSAPYSDTRDGTNAPSPTASVLAAPSAATSYAGLT